MKRIYQAIVEDHLKKYEQMIFLAGPRQVGKTTIAMGTKKLSDHFKSFNWDKLSDREQIMSMKDLLKGFPIDALLKQKPIIVFDEIYKHPDWKNFLKGFVDEYKHKLGIIVTGSTKLNTYRRGGDSLMGRYFLYRVFPFSIAELLRTDLPSTPVSLPKKIDKEKFDALVKFGGFPEPFIKQEDRFYNRWQNLRQQQMLREDIRDGAKIQELGQLELLTSILRQQMSQSFNYATLANKVRVSDQTIRRWMMVLEAYYYCFTLKPWSRNISRSLLKEPKLYLWDWSEIENRGAKLENFVACHLLKAVHYWTDVGLGKYELFFLRDKEKREVDFIIIREGKPWILIEVKSSAKESLSKNLYHYQEQTKAEHAFQVVFDLPYVERDCFAEKKPIIVPASTFLSQLI